VIGSLLAGAVAILGSFAAVGYIALWAGLLRHRETAVFLKELPAEPPAGGWPSLAVIFAAKDEGAAVERAARSMLALDYPGLEVIAVDDRSADATGAILDALAAEDARLRVFHVRALPPGWLGKSHALQMASEATSAEWILFTDADVLFEPTALLRAVAWAVWSGLDHLIATPDVLTESLGERMFLAMFSLLFAFRAPLWKVANPRSKVALGIGAFNLVRAEAFRAIGGFRRLALSVDEDMRLGEALKFAGYRAGVVLGHQAVLVRWQVGLGGMIRGLEKNSFAGLDFRLTNSAAIITGILALGVLPYLGLFVGSWHTRIVCAAGVGAAALILGAVRGQGGLAWYHALFLPIGALACALSLVRSVWLTLRRGGVRWRDHVYSLDELRAHVRLRNAWLREVWLSTR
jgi:glycosyltransferase involved in cell wall biosynthesis